MEDKEKAASAEKQFRENIRKLLIDWYANCPNSMKFTSSVIKEYKKTFPDDQFMKEIGEDL